MKRFSEVRCDITARLYNIANIPNDGSAVVPIADQMVAALYVDNVPLTLDTIESWGMCVRDVMNEARYNLANDYKIKGMREILADLGCPEEMLPPLSEEGKEMMYVVTSGCGILGAGVILSPDVMKAAREMIGNFIILPSSIHEVILVPNNEDANVDGLNGIINTVNTEQVAPEEQLSNKAYVYNFETNEFEAA
jgi:hypothetical protein